MLRFFFKEKGGGDGGSGCYSRANVHGSEMIFVEADVV